MLGRSKPTTRRGRAAVRGKADTGADRRRARTSTTGLARGRGRGRAGSRRDGLLPWPVFFVAVAVLVVLAVAAGALTARAVSTRRALDAQQERRQTVLRAAKQNALNFTTIGYKHVDRDINRVIAGAAGEFKTSYKRNRKTVEKTVKENKSTSKGDVLGAGLVSVDPDSAVALVVVDSRVTNVAYKKPTVRHYRMRLTLVHKKDEWLVSSLEFVA